ncbi:TPA: hypothetical protein I2B74_000286 [Staphylococcus aureus]|nr:hypothetical protein [Staphylococcus aureus]
MFRSVKSWRSRSRFEINDRYRIGYGGGYYDRFLANYQTKTISLLYDFQITSFEPESFDQPVDKLIIYQSA